jgi:spore germination protein KB
MSDHLITGKQLQSLLTMFWLGTLVFLGFDNRLNQDTWIGTLISALLFLPLLFVYVRIIHLYPGQDLFEIMIQIFGTVVGKILTFIMVFYAIHLGALVIKTFSEFITLENLNEVPEILIFSCISLLAILSVTNGAQNIARLAKWVQSIVIFIILFTVLIGLKDMDFDNLKPIMNTDSKTLLTQSLLSVTLPFGEIVVCLPFFGSQSSLDNPLKIFLKSLGISTAIMVISNISIVLLLGVPSVSRFYFPAYWSLSLISLGDFFTRIEVLIGVNLVFAGSIEFFACLYSASLGVTRLFNFKNQKEAVVPCSLLILTLAGLLYSNSIEMTVALRYYPYYAVLFQVIIPVIVLIGAEIKKRKNFPKPQKPSQIKMNPNTQATQSKI